MRYELNKLIRIVVVIVAGCITIAEAKLVAYWKLDEINGNTVIDSSGMGNNGELSGNTKPAWQPAEGKYGGSLLFNGKDKDGYVDCGNFDYSETGQISIAMWVKWNGLTGFYQGLIGKSKGWNENGTCWYLSIERVEGYVAFGQFGSTPSFGKSSFPEKKWQHICITYDGTATTLYLGGEVVSTAISAFSFGPAIDAKVILGAVYNDGGDPFNGSLDDVAIFDHALMAADVRKLYNESGAVFINPMLQKLNNAIRESEDALKGKNFQKAIRLLEEKTIEYKTWQEKDPENAKEFDSRFADLHLLSAQIKQMAGFPKDDIVADYTKAIFSSKGGMALSYLFENTDAEKYQESIKKAISTYSDNNNTYKEITQQLESCGKWNAFELFLDTVFSHTKDPVVCASKIGSNLHDDTWKKKYIEYCRGKTNLTEYAYENECEAAERYAKKEDFKNAIEAYRNISQRYASDSQKAQADFKVCQYLFDSEEHQVVISELDSFIAKNRQINKKLTKEAILLKGQCYIQLGDIDKASDIFLKLTIEYSNTKEAPEAGFFTGYCYMLQNKFDQAKEVLNLVVRDYPQSSYANKAKLCLTRMENMTEK